jgi:hypothetical protein
VQLVEALKGARTPSLQGEIYHVSLESRIWSLVSTPSRQVPAPQSA